MLLGGVVDALHDLGSEDSVVDVRGELLAGADATDEGVDLGLEMRTGGVFGGRGEECAVLGGVKGEVLTVLETDAALIAHEVDVALVFIDVLGPCAVNGDDGAGGADQSSDGVVNVVGSVVLGGACPHAGVDVVLHVLAQLAEGLAGNGLGGGVAAAVHDDVQIMDTPVDQGAAACYCLGGEVAAKPGDGAERTEAGVDVVDFAQLAAVDDALDDVDAVIEAVDNADV